MPIKILMPALSPTMTEGNLVRWLVPEGHVLKSGDIMAEIETDKATMEVEAVDEGILARILVPAGTDAVAVNTPIAVILEEGETDADLTAYLAKLGGAAGESAPSPSPLSSQKTSEPMAPTAVKPAENAPARDRIVASPLAKKIAENHQLDLKTLAGTGPRGRIVKTDVEAALSRASSAPSLAAPSPTQLSGETSYTIEPLSMMRKVIAQRLTESKSTIPHFYLSIDCILDDLLAARADLNKGLADNEKISINDFVIKATAMALKKVPAANASFQGQSIHRYDSADISVAVAIEGGLVTPILRNASEKSLGALSQEMKELAAKARAGKLKPHEFQGGTFSISNLGMFGIREFAAVINPPQGAILAVGAGEQRAIVKNGQLAVGTVMSCTLSADHRVIDGAVGAAFLAAFKQYLTNPILMLY